MKWEKLLKDWRIWFIVVVLLAIMQYFSGGNLMGNPDPEKPTVEPHQQMEQSLNYNPSTFKKNVNTSTDDNSSSKETSKK